MDMDKQVCGGYCGTAFVDADLLDANNGATTRCASCALRDAWTGDLPDAATLTMSGEFLKEIITLAQPSQRQLATDGAGARICKVNECRTEVSGRYALCKAHGAQAPICGNCIDGNRVGYNARTGDWFTQCWPCSQAA